MLWTPTDSNCGVGAAPPELWRFAGITPVVVTNPNSVSLAAAIATAAAGSKLVKVVGTANLDTAHVQLTSGVSIYSDTGAQVIGNYALIPIANQFIIGFNFNGTGDASIQLNSSTATTDVRIIANTFKPGASANSRMGIKDSSTANNTIHSGLQIRRNVFDGHNYAFVGTRQSNLLIQNNKMVNTQNRNIVLYGATNTSVVGNYIDGGITCISWLMDAQFGRYVATNEFNLIADNTVLNFTEEGIGADVYGNVASSCSAVDTFAVISRNGSASNSPGVIVPRTALLSTSGYSVYFITGANAGLCCKSNFSQVVDGISIRIQMNNNSMTTAQFNAINPGDIVAVGHVFTRSKIVRNFVYTNKPVASCISMWGNTFDCLIADNILSTTGRNSIGLACIGGVPASTSQANNNNTTGKSATPVAGNTIVQNTILSGPITCFGKSYASQASTYAVTYKNTVADNIGTVVNESWRDVADVNFFGPAHDGSLHTGNVAASGVALTRHFYLTQNQDLPATNRGPRRDFHGRWRPSNQSKGAVDAARLRYARS